MRLYAGRATLVLQGLHRIWPPLIDLARRGSADVLPMIAKGGKHYDYLAVGAGFAGSVMAERLAAGSGKRVLVVDRRPHIAGNAYDHHDEAGILIHRYGPHIFHTNSQDIVDYLSTTY